MPERTNIQIDFSGGVDQRTDAKHVVPGKLAALVNGVFDKGGSIRKRRGFTALSRNTFGVAVLAAATRLATFGSELLLTDGDSLYSYSPAANKWAYRDQVSQALATRSPLTHGSTTFYSPDCAYGNGYVVFAWRENYNTSTGYGDIKASVVEVATGAQVLAGVVVASGQIQLYPRVVVVGTTAVILYGTSAGAIKARTVNLTNPTALGAATSILTDASADPVKAQMDACALSDRFAVIYSNNAGGATPKLQVKTFDPAALGAALASRTLADTSNPTTWNLAIRGVTGERLWIAYNSFAAGTSTIKATALNTASLADSTAPFAVSAPASVSGYPIGIERVDNVNAVVTWTEQDSVTNVRTSHCRAVSSVGAGSLIGAADHYLRRHIWLSKPFMSGSRCYALCAYAHDVFSTSSTAFLVDLTISDTTSATVLMRPVTNIAPRRSSCSPIVDVSANLCSVPAIVAGGTYAAATAVRKSAAGKMGMDFVTLDFASRSRNMNAELGGSLHLSGGVPAIYDGGRVIENNALVIPEPPFSVTQTSGTTGAVANGTYNYCITFARYDLQGQLQRSAPSAATTVVVAGGTPAVNHVDFRVAPYALTLLQDVESGFAPAWYIEVWRTTAGGTVFFKIPDAKTLWNGSSPGPILNDPTLLQTTISDLAADSDLTGQPFVYTTGGILENRCPPSAAIVAMHKERAWLAGTDDPKVIWFSQPYVFGEAPGFHDNLTITVEDGGPITALASLDGHLIIFKRDRIFFVDGDGPGLAGGVGFSTPQRIAVDLGCIDANSVAVLPEGIIFQSTAGIYLLDRALQVAYLSGPVEDTLAANPIITSAVVHETEFQVRISCKPSVGNAGVVLVYDYLVKQWSTFQLYDSVAAQGSTAVAGACNHAGVYKWVAPNGSAHQESATLYTDDGTWVTLSIATSWLKVGGLQGWVRAWAVQTLADYLSPHDLTIQIATDYSAAVDQTKTWSNHDLRALALEQVREAIRKQKCQAIRFAISDATPTGGEDAAGIGQGFSLAGLLLEAGVLRKAKRLPAVQRG